MTDAEAPGFEVVKPVEFNPVEQVRMLRGLAQREERLCDVPAATLGQLFGVSWYQSEGYPHGGCLVDEPPIVVLGAYGGEREEAGQNKGVVTTDIDATARVMLHGVDANALPISIQPGRVAGLIAENINFAPGVTTPGIKLDSLLHSCMEVLREGGTLIIETVVSNAPDSKVPTVEDVIKGAKKYGYTRCVVAHGPTYADVDLIDGRPYRFEDAKTYYLLQKGRRT